ncbi:MAG: RagB/SusD family nutrient uptake outer membrane protein [Prevotella sp.]|nr:RagB/SusD family nutrient uptake outer membrane protein [Prevotella sp.]
MKLYKISFLALAGLMTLASCNDIDEMEPASGALTENQVQAAKDLIPARAEASFSAMFTMMGMPNGVFNRTSPRADDFGFIMSAISLDAEGPDYIYDDSGYNWFSVCGEYSSRNANYANPYIRYATPYNQIKMANDLIKENKEATDSVLHNMCAQAHAMRAFDYLALVQYFQFNYQIAKDKPAVPIVTDETADETFTNNPRATVEEVFKLIMDDLDYAVQNLDDNRANKTRINQQVAYGLRARANLIMGNWAAALADAEKAMAGYEPATITGPSFVSIDEDNWIWGIEITQNMVLVSGYPTSSSWLSSFSADSYTAGAGCYAMINSMLWNKIPATDVRKGWWVDANLHSPLLANVTWGSATGDAVAPLKIKDIKEPFTPYTNVKFGMKDGIGSENNINDFPLMRVEEMILVKAECQARLNQEANARQTLESFVKTYRDPEYSSTASGRSLTDEIWYQRRVELWGEGFAMSDIMRLQKPLVRFHDATCNQPAAFRFNMPADDAWLLMRFCDSETNTNAGIIDNTGSRQPEQDQYPDLRDGVTD